MKAQLSEHIIGTLKTTEVRKRSVVHRGGDLQRQLVTQTPRMERRGRKREREEGGVGYARNSEVFNCSRCV